MKSTQKTRLTKLAVYLKELEQDEFNMEHLRSVNTSSNGGIVCSALGWSPEVDGLEPIESEYITNSYGEKVGVDFDYYDERVFGLEPNKWQWCFHPDWFKVDNTPTGAAKRIMSVVDNKVPANWEAQMTGNAPYMFAE